MAAEQENNAKKLERISGTLKHQVLNNLDAILEKACEEKLIDIGMLQLLVKKPIIDAANRLQTMKLYIENPGLQRPANGSKGESQ